MSTNKKTKEVGEHDYQLGDVVLAKIRGYPRWPGQVVDPDSVPPAVAKERPGGKKTKFYCVRFFPAGDYSWAVSKDLSLLQKHEIEAYINEPHKKSGDLLAGYKIALDPRDWEEKRANDRAAAEEAEADEEVDQLEEADEMDEDDEDEPKKKAGKKRKRESEPKPKKKKETKKSSSVGAEAKDKKAAAKKKGGKKNGARSKETIESEDADADDAEGEDAPAESSKRSGPVSKRSKKEQGGDEEHDQLASNPDAVKVKEWRHRLQRAFLSKVLLKPEEMPDHDQLFSTIESYDLTIDQLSYSKLGKVMRHISQLKPSVFPIPDEEKYKIRKRAEALLVKWQDVINQAEGVGNGVNGAETKNKVPAKVEDVKSSDGDKPSDAPVNGQTSTDAKPINQGHAAVAPDVPAEPLTVQGEVPMDIAAD